jgi:hypothetical protein
MKWSLYKSRWLPKRCGRPLIAPPDGYRKRERKKRYLNYIDAPRKKIVSKNFRPGTICEAQTSSANRAGIKLIAGLCSTADAAVVSRVWRYRLARQYDNLDVSRAVYPSSGIGKAEREGC